MATQQVEVSYNQTLRLFSFGTQLLTLQEVQSIAKRSIDLNGSDFVEGLSCLITHSMLMNLVSKAENGKEIKMTFRINTAQARKDYEGGDHAASSVPAQPVGTPRPCSTCNSTFSCWCNGFEEER